MLQVKAEVLEGFTEEDLQTAVECLINLKKTLSHLQHQLPYGFSNDDGIVLENTNDEQQVLDYDYMSCDSYSTEKFSNDDLRVVEENLENIKRKLEHLRRWLKLNENCEYCQLHDIDSCPKHGVISSDDQVYSSSSDTTGSQVLPEGLSIRKSELKVAGNGVWADIPFGKGVRFGPYLGLHVQGPETANESGYCWEVLQNKELVGCVSGKDRLSSNWLRNVNCACDEEHQNLLAFFCGGHVSYCTYKTIQAGTELLVWYSDSYAKDAGLSKADASKETGSLQLTQSGQLLAAQDALHPPQSIVDENPFLAIHQYWLLHPYSAQEQESYLAPLFQFDADRKPCVCSFCGEMFLQSIQLELHLRSHYFEAAAALFRKGHRPEMGSDAGKDDALDRIYRCPHCDKAFTRRHVLTTHIRIHTGQKPYRCSYCDRCFSQSSERRAHIIRKHTGVFPHSCKECGKGFILPCDLRRHVKNSHT